MEFFVCVKHELFWMKNKLYNLNCDEDYFSFLRWKVPVVKNMLDCLCLQKAYSYAWVTGDASNFYSEVQFKHMNWVWNTEIAILLDRGVW
jgi:hypothetical protein